MNTAKLICILALAGLGLAACGKKTAASAAASEPTPQNFLAVYTQVYQAMKAGDVAAFRVNRDPERVAELEKTLAEMNSKLTGEILRVYAGSWVDPAGYSPSGTKILQDRARVSFSSPPETDAFGNPRVKVLIVMFRKLPDGWMLRDTGSSTAQGPGGQLSEEGLPDELKLP